MLKAEGAFGSIDLLSNTSVVMVSSGQCSEILFLISNNDANWNSIFGICLGCIWNHFGVTRALRYVSSTCDVIIVVLVSSGQICTNHAWINPTLWFISILISFWFCSIVIQYKKRWNHIPIICGSPTLDYVYLVSSGHYGRPRGFHVIFLFEEDIYPK